MMFMQAYSIDLRKRVMAAYDSGKYTLQEVSNRFGVTSRWIQQLRERRQKEGSISAHPQNQGRKAAFVGQNLEELDGFVASHPDATLEEMKEHFSGRVNCSIVTVSSTLKRLGWRYKKSRYERRSRTGTT